MGDHKYLKLENRGSRTSRFYYIGKVCKSVKTFLSLDPMYYFVGKSFQDS